MQAQSNDEYFLYEPVQTPCWSGWFEPDVWTYLQSGPIIGYLFWNWVLSLLSWEFFVVIIILQSHHNFCTETKQILEVDIILSELHVCYCMSFDSILQPCFFLSLWSDSWWRPKYLASTCASHVATVLRTSLLRLGRQYQNLDTTSNGSVSNFIPAISWHFSTQHSNICHGSSSEFSGLDTISFHGECVSLFCLSSWWGHSH